jgi:hypothetical protein
MKLGADTVAALEGTTLASAREQDELVFLNRGASEGELTEPVRDLVARAVRGEMVSAIEFRKSGAAFRREKVSACNVPQQREAAAGRLRVAITVDFLQADFDRIIAWSDQHHLNRSEAVRRLVRKGLDSEQPKAGNVVPLLGGMSESADKTVSKDAAEDLELRFKHVGAENTALRSEVRELKAALANKLAAISNEKLLAELERRLSPQFLRAHQATLKAVARALETTEHHLGPTLDLKAADSEATKH